KVTQEGAPHALTGLVFRRLKDRACNPAVALIVYGVGTLELRETAIWRLQSGLQVRTIIDRMTPSVTGKKLEVLAEPLRDVDGQCVVPGVGVRPLRVNA